MLGTLSGVNRLRKNVGHAFCVPDTNTKGLCKVPGPL